MSQHRLLVNSNFYLGFTLPWIAPLVDKYFYFELFDATSNYDPNNTTVLISYIYQDSEWVKTMLDRGFRVIIDHLWDGDVDAPSLIQDNIMILRNKNWIWYHSCIEWTHHQYNHYCPSPYKQHAFFMPMNRQEWHRDKIIESLKSVLPNALYSYVAKEKYLNNDTLLNGQISWRSYFNPDWYNSSFFSVVAESYMRSSLWEQTPHSPQQVYKTEVSEKLFKPMQGYHPFIVFGSVDTLAYLRKEGFETFDNIFNEDYDKIVNDQERHAEASEAVILATEQWKKGKLYVDSVTQEKLNHNHARLFDHAHVYARFQSEIVDSVLEFINL